MRARLSALSVGLLATAACSPRPDRIAAQTQVCQQAFPGQPDSVADCLHRRHRWRTNEAMAVAYAQAALNRTGAPLLSSIHFEDDHFAKSVLRRYKPDSTVVDTTVAPGFRFIQHRTRPAHAAGILMP